MSKQYNADLFVKNGGLSTEVLMADGGVSPSSDFVNPTSTFLPINESDAFTDSPIFAERPLDYEGFSSLKTKVNGFAELPVGGIGGTPSWGISAELSSTNQRVQLGDFDDYTFAGKFEYGQGGIAPANASYIKFDTYGYDLFECTYNYFKLDAKTGNPSRVDGLLYNSNSGIIGFGAGLDVTSRSSSEASIVWDFYGGDFKIKGFSGDDCFYSNIANGQTYIQSQNSKLGIEQQAMYISDDLQNTNSVSGSHTKILNVRDASGNSYGIKLHPYN